MRSPFALQLLNLGVRVPPAAELGGEGSGYGGSEEGSCGGELQCHPVHADVTVVHKVADKDGVCIGEDKRTAADEKRPYRIGDEAPEMVCGKSGGAECEVFDTEHAGDDNCDDESAKEPCKRVAKEDCNYPRVSSRGGLRLSG